MCSARWLDVEVGSDDIDLNTLPSNLALVDLYNDNDYKLLVGDIGRGEEGPKLKVFKGAMQTSDLALPDLPLAVVGFYMNESMPRSMPVVAVAFSFSVYVYRNMKLFYKYYLPSIEWNSSEMDIWKQLTDTGNHTTDAINRLTDNLQSLPQSVMSHQSRQFLQLNVDQQLEYLEHTPGVPTKRVPEIAAMTTLKMNSVDRYAVSCLVVATEEGDVIILDPQTFTQIYQAKVCEVKKTPYQMIATGLYNVDYRIIIATREKSVCMLKREWKEGRIIFTTEEHIVAMEVLTADHSIVVICTDNTMASYSKKGKKQWSASLEQRPRSLCLLPVAPLGMVLVGVALATGRVLLYDGDAVVDSMVVRDVVSAMKFGQLGQEEHVLIIITTTGNLMLKILKRTAEFTSGEGEGAAGVWGGGAGATGATTATRPWIIPKKSKLFIEQSVREKENAVAMHEGFQLELNRLRLTAARALLDAHRQSQNAVGAGAMEPVRMSAEVEGLGPVFRMVLVVQNTSSDKAVIGLAILFHHTTNYKITNPYIKVPLLPPGGVLRFPTKVEEIFTELTPDRLLCGVTGSGGERAIVKVLLLKEGRQGPALAATVTMPPTDPIMLPYDKIQSTDTFT